ncbi:MAG: hypothetical protein FJ293_14990 [Planctomycetes bacterium]|nr:hypothetical protein [Planctomycetota bacterium]
MTPQLPPAEPPPAPRGDSSPEPLSAAERAADQRSLRLLVGWLGGCALLGSLYLVFAIWLDWV